jgi:oligogalacturonide lyase
MSAGTAYPPEWQIYHDPQTGREVKQLTGSPAEDYHLYFYNPSVTPDGRYLLFFSERTGLSNLFRLDLQSGEIVQLSDAGPERADYFPFTGPLQGAGACLACIGAAGREVFYFQGIELWASEIESARARHVLSLAADRRPSILNADAMGATLVFATIDEALFKQASERAFRGEPFPDEAYYQATTSTICRLDAASDRCEEVLRCEGFWINHVLIHPHDRDQIEFCHEFTDQHDRMWLLNAATGQFAPIPGQGAGEWYQHEFWNADGSRIYYHAGISNDETHGFCGWCLPDGSGYAKFEHRTPGRAYGHYNLHPSGEFMVTDGEAHPGCISKVHLRDGWQEFEVLCRHDSYQFPGGGQDFEKLSRHDSVLFGDDQRCHPHPVFTPDGRSIIFTSNRAGSSNIYLVNLD